MRENIIGCSPTGDLLERASCVIQIDEHHLLRRASLHCRGGRIKMHLRQAEQLHVPQIGNARNVAQRLASDERRSDRMAVRADA